MRYLTLLMTSLFLTSSMPSHAWVIDADFEGGTLGSVAGSTTQPSSGFSEPGTGTIYSNEQVHSGSMAAKATIRARDDGFGEFGGNWKFGSGPLSHISKPSEGDELWYRIWLYIPQEFSFYCGGCTTGPKFMRTPTQNASTGKGQGGMSLYVTNAGLSVETSLHNKSGQEKAQDIFYKEQHPWPENNHRNLGGGRSHRGAWHAYEIYYKYSSVKGQSIFRAWFDGKLEFEDKVTPTLLSPSSKASHAQLFTYWRSKPELNPKNTQSVYIDDVIITDERPDAKDSKGNPYIGVGNANFTARPKPPNLLTNH